MKSVVTFTFLVAVLFSCGTIKQKTKEAINKGGETVGKGATEFANGVSEGIDKSLECKLELSPGLVEKGLETGVLQVNNGDSGEKNIFTVYLIFNKDFNQDMTLKIYNKDNQEYGRATAHIEGKAKAASYFDFVFDQRTSIESKSKLIAE